MSNDQDYPDLSKPLNLAQDQGSDFPDLSQPMADNSRENLGYSMVAAPFRVGGDLIKGLYPFIKNIPGYYETAKTEVPGAFQALVNHPAHAALQALAGTQEGINNLAQLPKNLAQYGHDRLHLVPQGAVNAVNAITPEDTTQAINSLFDQPQYAGEDLLRGAGRNAFNLAGGAKVASMLNPLNLTSKSIAKDILETSKKNQLSYKKLYGNLFDEASNKGFDDALHNVDIDMKTLKKYSPKKSIQGVLDFNENPTLDNAHRAKSDLLRIQRDLNDMPTLRTAERKQLNAATSGVNSLLENMFRNSKGVADENMLNRYNAIQQGFARDVLPYRNKHINEFKRGEKTPDELVNALSNGKFYAQRGKYHPSLGLRKMIADHPVLSGLSAGGVGAVLANALFGNHDE